MHAKLRAKKPKNTNKYCVASYLIYAAERMQHSKTCKQSSRKVIQCMLYRTAQFKTCNDTIRCSRTSHMRHRGIRLRLERMWFKKVPTFVRRYENISIFKQIQFTRRYFLNAHRTQQYQNKTNGAVGKSRTSWNRIEFRANYAMFTFHRGSPN